MLTMLIAVMVMMISYKHNPENIMIMMITTTIVVGFHVVDYDFIYTRPPFVNPLLNPLL